MIEKITQILDFWFGSHDGNLLQNVDKWWKVDPKWDLEIEDKFSALHKKAIAGQLQHWLSQPRSCLAYIILLDQFSRNMYRNTPQAFAQDALAQQACEQGRAHKLDKELILIERQFFYMPLMHSEEISDQHLSVALFKQLRDEAKETNSCYLSQMVAAYKHAIAHCELINQFGRFPHRNKILQRESSEVELAYLDEMQ